MTSAACRAAGERATACWHCRLPSSSTAAEAELVAFLWRAALHCSLVHDVGMGIDTERSKTRPAGAASTPTSHIPAQRFAILACAFGDVRELDGMELIEIGTVG